MVIKFQNEKSITHSDQTAKPVDRFVSSKATEITKHKQLLLKVVRVKKKPAWKKSFAGNNRFGFRHCNRMC